MQNREIQADIHAKTVRYRRIAIKNRGIQADSHAKTVRYMWIAIKKGDTGG
jgi:hypothetical protein